MVAQMFHYTDKDGFNVIRSAPVWLFKASQPPGGHPIGAYFTDMLPNDRQGLKRLRIPRDKREYCFAFIDKNDLVKLPGRRGDYVFYSPQDYSVTEDRQQYNGLREKWVGVRGEI